MRMLPERIWTTGRKGAQMDAVEKFLLNHPWALPVYLVICYCFSFCVLYFGFECKFGDAVGSSIIGMIGLIFFSVVVICFYWGDKDCPVEKETRRKMFFVTFMGWGLISGFLIWLDVRISISILAPPIVIVFLVFLFGMCAVASKDQSESDTPDIRI